MPKVKPLTVTQERYGNLHCFEHVAFMRNKGKEAFCGECGQRFEVEASRKKSIRCPHCGAVLNPNTKHRMTYRDKSYYMVLDTAGRFQILRWFLLETYQHAGEPAIYYHSEVSQVWITTDGKRVIVEKCRLGSFYVDTFCLNSAIEIRDRSESVLQSVVPMAVFNRGKITADLKRRGITNDFHGLAPDMLIDAIIQETHAETIYKAGQYRLLDYLICSRTPTNYYWPSVRICIRNGYTIEKGDIWCDMVSNLRFLGKDLRNAHYVCPDNLNEAHQKWLLAAHRKRLRKEKEDRLNENLKWEKKYAERKKSFFAITITDGEINLKVLRSAEEFFQEGEAMHHCVFENGYYKKPQSLILSAKIGGKRIETVEVSLDSFKVVQSRGVCNENTEYHDRIIALVEKNMNKIRRCARKEA